LQLIAVVARTGGSQEHTAISARLTGAGNVCRDFPLDVKLIVLEVLLGFDVSRLLVHREDAVRDGPFSRRLVVLGGDPLIEVLAVEQDDRVRRRRAAFVAGRHFRRNGLPDFGVFRFRLLREKTASDG
jgi:hypothetical protein